jgi:hypothetical protein
VDIGEGATISNNGDNQIPNKFQGPITKKCAVIGSLVIDDYLMMGAWNLDIESILK